MHVLECHPFCYDCEKRKSNFDFQFSKIENELSNFNFQSTKKKRNFNFDTNFQLSRKR